MRVGVLLALVDRLMLEPRSMYRAKELGGVEWFAWGYEHGLLADTVDSVTLNTLVTSRSKRRFQENMRAWRPELRERETAVVVEAGSVAEMDWGRALSALM